MKAEVKGGKLIIEIDLQEPAPSSSGKTLVIASSRGGQATTATVDGKPVKVNISAWIAP